MSIDIAPLEPTDLLLLPTLQPPDWGSIIPAHEFYLSSDFCFSFKFIHDHSIAGTGSLIVHENSAWLAHIIVHPEHRNKGLGEFITRTLIDVAKKKHCDFLSLIATESGEPVYKKCGFKAEAEYLFYRDLQRAPEEPLSPCIVPYEEGYKSRVLSLDRTISGENRTALLEPLLNDAMVYLNMETIEGFYLPGAGEGLISANTAMSGLSLSHLRFANKGVAIFPTDNLILRGYLQDNGHIPFRTAKRMNLGVNLNWQPQNIYNRIGGNLG